MAAVVVAGKGVCTAFAFRSLHHRLFGVQRHCPLFQTYRAFATGKTWRSEKSVGEVFSALGISRRCPAKVERTPDALQPSPPYLTMTGRPLNRNSVIELEINPGSELFLTTVARRLTRRRVCRALTKSGKRLSSPPTTQLNRCRARPILSSPAAIITLPFPLTPLPFSCPACSPPVFGRRTGDSFLVVLIAQPLGQYQELILLSSLFSFLAPPSPSFQNYSSLANSVYHISSFLEDNPKEDCYLLMPCYA
ncbi:hypothetical protein B0T20DRAFT_88050 [Sordaria brevicollis]|uniref:Uncharacterized protein n=1 Tax=Sordaria brevicollis TaxID=83679 RepID=A0AAE0NWS2_SORBR|nr:hypothetical protein B0T20DRAFT_88050 [Sordaria brevicollis]